MTDFPPFKKASLYKDVETSVTSEAGMKPHFTGATYELTQANMNGLIEQLESANDEIKNLNTLLALTKNSREVRLESENKKLRTALEKIAEYFCACSDGDEIIPQLVAQEALEPEQYELKK